MSNAQIALSAEHVPRDQGRTDPHGWGYCLLIATVLALFIRPADLIPALDDLPIYQVIIIACVVVSARSLLELFSLPTIVRQPVTVCLVLLLFSIIASHLVHGAVWEARHFGWEYFKQLTLYLLVVGLLTTPDRLDRFITLLTLAIVLVASLALLDQLQVISLSTIESVQDSYTAADSEKIRLDRIRGTGIFQDPNDLGLIIVTGIVLSAYKLSTPVLGLRRYLWGVPLVIMMIALMNTHSRGAFLSLVTVIPAWMIYRHGWKQALVATGIALPLMWVVFSGRMTEVDSVVSGTGQSRVQIWSDTLQLLREYPLTGLGQGMLVEEMGVASHNSFLHSYAELGLIGGTLFAGAFLAAISLLSPWQLKAAATDDRIERLRPFLFAALIGYSFGLLTLSRQFVGPTYLMLGLAVAADQIGRRQRETIKPVNAWFFVKIALGGATGLLGLYVLIRLLVRW